MNSATSGLEPDVIFFILVRVLILSPGLILSGEYPAKKSLLYFNLLFSSIIGIQYSSVRPGYTVLS